MTPVLTLVLSVNLILAHLLLFKSRKKYKRVICTVHCTLDAHTKRPKTKRLKTKRPKTKRLKTKRPKTKHPKDNTVRVLSVGRFVLCDVLSRGTF